MLEVHTISKAFAGFVAVDRISLCLLRGEIAAVIGPNGAGKTTFFNLITGHLQPDSGRILLKGRDITGAPPHRICLMGMGRSFQRTNIFSKLTVYENVQAAFISHRGRGTDFWSRATDLYRHETEALLASLGLDDKAAAIGGTLSHGNQKQVELAIALACDPEILLLDEPTAGMSPAETQATIRLLQRIALERDQIHAAYGNAPALFGVSLEVASGECVCLLGRNGVGKTTTLRSIIGLNAPTSGAVLWRGQPITAWPPHRVARLGIGFVPEDRRIFAELSAWENLDVARRVSGRSGPWTIQSVCELFP